MTSIVLNRLIKKGVFFFPKKADYSGVSYFVMYTPQPSKSLGVNEKKNHRVKTVISDQ